MLKSYSLVLAAFLNASPSVASDTIEFLTEECERVYQVYPRLALAAMLEGDVDCGEPGGEYVSCNDGETVEEKTERERRLAVRSHQQASYKPAEKACRAWSGMTKSDFFQSRALQAIKNARLSDKWRPGDKLEQPTLSTVRIRIDGFECGDNCYLEFIELTTVGEADPLGKTQIALCNVDACVPWFEEQALPPEYIGRSATATIGRGKQYDNEGNVMSDDFSAILSITVDPVE